ncbi:acyl-CoA thioesterase [Celeribacter halophilus]|uniref:Acyl-CoA thioesterase n=1 Tax=Celeribacter halophilus TaxID=576117 RepID=A0AAW7XWM8_9RHOB|nr:acyl-CoA thioesterase [Celeribacter halophilus]MBU2890979.1 acyl-CoA thioesterase [Celeribacter halophilus]MDO6458714.1 acyl-CoA thioesterase [Celeribacter halophilus]MDO6511135.1 acyl-CoA thioesterase [Celeribacter halophilus]MDO6722468.1 acyl-CoA thioesterase [Celeribacter halophilus]
MSDAHTPEGMELTLRTLAMPADTNASGDIFGGWVMSQMDLAAAIRANERCNGRTVTIAANEIVFKKPVKVGDTLCVYTAVDQVGRSSMVIRIEVWARRAFSAQRDHVTEARFTMVAVDEAGKPRPVDEAPETGAAE